MAQKSADDRAGKPQTPHERHAKRREDALDDAIADSFPASDPPAMTGHTPSKPDARRPSSGQTKPQG